MENNVKVVPIVVGQKGRLPKYAHQGDAGCDLYTTEDIMIHPGETAILSTNIRVQLPEGYEIQIRPRSGIARKTNLLIPNSPATIDSGYRGDIGILVKNADIDLAKYFSDYTNDYEVVDVSKIDEEVGESGYVDRDVPVIYKIPKGTRIAQMVVSKYIKAEFVAVDQLDESERGTGAYGSSKVL